MAELNVQPKNKRPWWLWLLLALLALALLFFLLRGCNRDTDTDDTASGAAADSSAITIGPGHTTDNGLNWDAIAFDAPDASYEEITDKDIQVRGNDDYVIYSVDETVLFDSDKNTIRSNAAEKLKQVATSMSKRYSGGEVRIYGHTDAKGSKGYNQQLAEQRAEAVKNWLVQNGNIPADRISLHPVGESRPVASNATTEGRQENRRVEIVARRSDQAQ